MPSQKNLLRDVLRSAVATLCLVAVTAPNVNAADAGALVEFQPQTPARADDVNQNFTDLRDAVNSKSTSGVEYAASDSSVQIAETSATPTVVSTLSLTAPGPGTVVVDFSAYMTIGHTKDAGNSYAVCAIKTDATSPDSATGRLQGSRRFVPILSQQVSGTYYPHLTTRGVLAVTAAGTVTLNLVCYRNGTSTSGTMFYRTLTATFHEDRL